jgi:hypothetical protein
MYAKRIQIEKDIKEKIGEQGVIQENDRREG